MKKGYLLILLSGVLAVSGCSRRGERDRAAEEETKSAENSAIYAEAAETPPAEGAGSVQIYTYDFPSEYTRETEKVSFQTKITADNISDSRVFFKGTASEQKLDGEKLKEQLLGDKEAEEHVMEGTDYTGQEGEDKIWQTASGETLYVSSTVTSYVTPLFHHISQAFVLPESKDEDSGYSTSDEFEDFSREDAYLEIKTALENSGISVPDDYICYTLPAEAMKEREYPTDMDGNEDVSAKKSDWSREDDTYYFVFQSRYCGLPAWHPYVYKMSADILGNAPLQAAVSRNGIVYLLLERMFDYQTEEECVELQPFEKIADALEVQFSRLLGEETYRIGLAELKAMEKMTGADSYEMVPVWIVHGEIHEDGETRQFQKVFDARTAEEILFS